MNRVDYIGNLTLAELAETPTHFQRFYVDFWISLGARRVTVFQEILGASEGETQNFLRSLKRWQSSNGGRISFANRDCDRRENARAAWERSLVGETDFTVSFGEVLVRARAKGFPNKQNLIREIIEEMFGEFMELEAKKAREVTETETVGEETETEEKEEMTRARKKTKVKHKNVIGKDVVGASMMRTTMSKFALENGEPIKLTYEDFSKIDRFERGAYVVLVANYFYTTPNKIANEQFTKSVTDAIEKQRVASQLYDLMNAYEVLREEFNTHTLGWEPNKKVNRQPTDEQVKNYLIWLGLVNGDGKPIHNKVLVRNNREEIVREEETAKDEEMTEARETSLMVVEKPAKKSQRARFCCVVYGDPIELSMLSSRISPMFEDYASIEFEECGVKTV